MAGGPMLEVDDLRVRFDTPAGTITAVDGVSLTLGERALAKYAVRCGGGSSHRYGLDDAVRAAEQEGRPDPEGHGEHDGGGEESQRGGACPAPVGALGDGQQQGDEEREDAPARQAERRLWQAVYLHHPRFAGTR